MKVMSRTEALEASIDCLTSGDLFWFYTDKPEDMRDVVEAAARIGGVAYLAPNPPNIQDKSIRATIVIPARPNPQAAKCLRSLTPDAIHGSHELYAYLGLIRPTVA